MDAPCSGANAGLLQAGFVQLDQILGRNDVIVAVEEIAASGQLRAYVARMGQTGFRDEVPAKSVRMTVLTIENKLPCQRLVISSLVDD